MDEKELDLEKQINPSDDKSSQENKDEESWQFEAEAYTLNSSVLDNGEFEIEIPEKKEFEKRFNQKPVPAASDSVNVRMKKIKKKDGILFGIVSAIVAVAIVGCAVAGHFFYSVQSDKISKENLRSGNLKPADIAMSVGDIDVSLGLYSYYYSVVVESYVQQAGYSNNLNTELPYDQQKTTNSDGKEVTWDKYFEEQTLEKLSYILSYYQKGLENGVKLTKENKQAIKENLSSLKEYAEENGEEINSFIKKNYGKYCTYETLEVMLEQCYIAENYYQQYMVENKPSPKEELEFFEKKSKDDFNKYQTVSVGFLQLSYEAENEKSRAAAVKKAEKYVSQIKSSEDMAKLIPVVYKDDIKAYVEGGNAKNEEECIKLIAESMIQDYCVAVMGDSQRLDESIEKWLFSDKTKVNSAKYFDIEQDSAIYIILKNSESYVDENEVFSVRHILVQPSSEEENEDEEGSEGTKEYTKEEWAEAKKKAEKILEEYKKGDKSEYSFAKLAEKYSEDPGSVSSGGTFGGLLSGYSKGQTVKNFENWAFDKKRKYGDVGIIKTEYGYHIMFFIETDKAYLDMFESEIIEYNEKVFQKSFDVVPNKKHIALIKADLPDSAQKESE